MTYQGHERAGGPAGARAKNEAMAALPELAVAVGVVVAGPAGVERVLTTRRRADQPLGGLWELPGGKVEPGESAEAAVRRELREEVGIEVRVVGRLPETVHAYAERRVRLLPFWCELVSGEARAIEVAEVAWVKPAELRGRPFPAANASLIGAVIEALRD